MAHLGKKFMSFTSNNSNELFDSQCILDSLPNGVAFFDNRLTLVQSNSEFNKLFSINKKNQRPYLRYLI